MAYATKYVFTFQSVGGTTREIRILKDGYSGDPIRRALGRAPILKKQQNGPVHGTSLELYAECHVDQEFIEFYTSDPKAYRVDLYAGNALLWQGWITPELYSEPDIAPPYDVQVVATDGVGELKLYDFAAQGVVSLRAMLTYLLGKTGLSTDVFLVSSLKGGSAGAGALLDMEANFDYLVGKTCYEALSYLLTTLHATITWWGGHWLLVRENNVTFTSGKVRYFNVAGNSALLANSVQALGSMYQDAVWPVGQLSTVIDPAKNKVVVQAPWHPVTALQNSDMTADANWNKSGVTYDSTKGAYFFARDVITPGELAQSVAFGGLRAPMRMTLSGCGTSETGSGFTGTGNGWVGLVLKFQDGDGNVYYLGVDGDGNRRWELYDSGRIPRAFEQDLLSVDTDRENADRIELDIPALAVDGGFPSGTLTVGIWGGAVYVFSAHLDVVLNKGYQDVLHIDNGARGEGDDTEIAFGRVTSDVAYYQAFVQGILLNNGALITAFSDANFTTGADYLSFISRDYARSVALPRARVEGTVSLEPSVQLPPLVFTKGGLDYWLETWSWNLYEDELQVSARTLPTATLTVESETITEAGGSASTGSSSGGATQVPSSGVNYFEPGAVSGLIQLKSVYNFLGVGSGAIFNVTDEEDVADSPAHLMLRNIAEEGEEPEYALYTPFHLITGGDQIVEGGTPGGGGGGGASYLWELLDVDDNLQSPAAGALLQYDSVAGLWKGNAPATQIGANVTGLTTGALIYGVLGDGFNPNWTVKDFINSSIATATATYRGNYNEYSDLGLQPSATHAQIATALASEISGADANDYCFVEVPTSASTPTEIERTERYKYDGTSWAYEYTLNNSGFTAAQWASINSGITSGKVATYDTIAGYFSGGKILSTALPAMYIGKTAVQNTSATEDLTGIGNITLDNAKYLRAYNTAEDTLYNLAGLDSGNRGYLGAANSPRTSLRGNTLYFLSGDSGDTLALYINAAQTASFYGTVYLQNNKSISWKNKPAEGASEINIGLLNLSSSNVLTLGSGLIATGNNARAYNTYIYGASLSFYTGSSTTGAVRKWMIGAAGDLYPYSNKAYNIGASSYYIKDAYISKIFLDAGVYLKYNSTAITASTDFSVAGALSATGNGTIGGTLGVTGAATLGSTLGVTGLATFNGGAFIPTTKKLTIGDAEIEWVPGVNGDPGYLHIKSALLTDGDQMLAGGTPGGGGSTQYLNDLLDVTITNPSPNEILRYNGTNWVNSEEADLDIATPSYPATPDQNVTYMVSEAGTYNNFGGLVVNEGELALMKYANGGWTKQATGAATNEQIGGFVVSPYSRYAYNLEQGKTYCVRNTGTANTIGFYGYTEGGTGVALATSLYPGDIALFTATQDYVQVDISGVPGAEVVLCPLDSCAGVLNYSLKSIGYPFVIKQGGIYVPFHRNAGRDFIVRNTGSAGFYVYGYDSNNTEYQLCYAYAGRISYFKTPATIEQLYISSVAGASAEVYEVGTLLGDMVERSREPIALRAVSFNAGDFSGIGITPPSDAGALTYRKLLGKINGAIVGTQEDIEEYGGSENVRQKIFPMFPYYVRTGTGNYNYKGFASDSLVTNVERISYTGASFNHPWFLRGILHVGGREVLVVSFHFDWADKDRRALQIQQIIAYCANYQRVIMMGDTNPENTSGGTVIDPNNKYLYETEWAIFAAAGYKMANGGDFGYFGTCLDNGDWRPYDNVFVSGGTISIKQADIITESWMDDHKPMIADIVIL